MYTLLFTITLLILAFTLKYLSPVYALDIPDHRKFHSKPTSQIGGLLFGAIFITVCSFLSLLPLWFIVGGIVSILLGAIDDKFSVSWYFKLMVQLLLIAFLSYIFWERFQFVSFYGYTFPMSQLTLLIVFSIWFVGIYNAVNLIDGLDGLAGGFMLLLCLGLGLSGSGSFATLNLMLSVILIGFLVFNQRPAKLFMGDAGSLLLGFHVAVLPLLFLENASAVPSLNMTTFVLLVSYLVADTTRVFFTRIAAKKSPMTADTIHFHHLILQQSGSYLSSIGSIFIITLLSAIGTVFSFHLELSTNMMLVHLALLLFFILTPPVQTYVPLITKIVGPIYNWQTSHNDSPPFLPRSIFMVVLFLGLIASLYFYVNPRTFITWQNGLAVILLFIFILFYRKDIMVKYVIQLGLVLFFSELYWGVELGIFTKLFTTFLLISYIVFTLEKRFGANIRDFSALDLLMIIITLGGVTLGLFGIPISIWFFLTMFSLWFGTSFVLNRTGYFNLK